MGVTNDSLADYQTLWGVTREYIYCVDPDYSSLRFDFNW